MIHKRRKGTLWITLGLLMIGLALSLICYNRYDDLRGSQAAWDIVSAVEMGSREAAATQPPVELSEKPLRDPDRQMPVKTVDGAEIVGILRIPSLELELPIINQWSYPSLKTAPCRYSGSAYQNNLILCGHNYAAHFGNLKTLREGESVQFTDMEGTDFLYEVVALETLTPTAVEEMAGGNWDLTLFTCTLGGESRVTIRCRLSGCGMGDTCVLGENSV